MACLLPAATELGMDILKWAQETNINRVTFQDVSWFYGTSDTGDKWFRSGIISGEVEDRTKGEPSTARAV
jgi:predicted metalloprotease